MIVTVHKLSRAYLLKICLWITDNRFASQPNTVDGRNPGLSPYLQVFIHPRWLFGISSINSITVHLVNLLTWWYPQPTAGPTEWLTLSRGWWCDTTLDGKEEDARFESGRQPKELQLQLSTSVVLFVVFWRWNPSTITCFQRGWFKHQPVFYSEWGWVGVVFLWDCW